jgi:Cu(I)/Ag(I) efflux system membrane fusion protein
MTELGSKDVDTREPLAETQAKPPPRGTRVMAALRWGLVLLSALVAALSWWSYARGEEAGASAHYHCPMHPQIVADAPGECPICHMALEPVPESRNRVRAAPTPAGSAAPSRVAPPKPARSPDEPDSAPASKLEYSCPMHPEVKSASPGRCPICKMPLEKPEPKLAPVAPVDGVVPVTLELDRVQSIGVRTSVVKAARPAGKLRVTATVESPERQTGQVHVRVPGFVERIAVKDTGVRVARGQELIAVYSPELYQAQSEFLLARRWNATGPNTTLDPARRKLELLGMSGAAIERIAASGEPTRAVSIAAPVSGTVVKKNVVLGSYVTPEIVLYEIVDLSSVYVVADVFQSDIPHVKLGTSGRFSMPARSYAADVKVDLIYPNVAPESRTTRVRMLVRNKELDLMPGQYGSVEFDIPAETSNHVVVPRDALIDTGLQRYVFVDKGHGRFEPRAVSVAAERLAELELDSGVAAGERVVSGATFLIDSESRLSASLAEQLDGGAAPYTDHAP